MSKASLLSSLMLCLIFEVSLFVFWLPLAMSSKVSLSFYVLENTSFPLALSTPLVATPPVLLNLLLLDF